MDALTAMKQALEAFAPIVTKLHQDAAIKALRAAIAEMEKADVAVASAPTISKGEMK